MEVNEMNTELVCVVANLGYFDGDDYFKGADCLASLKDIVRFLRKEDDGCDIRRQLGHTQLLQKDLVPLLINELEDKELIDIVIRLLVNLTSPANICFNKKPDEAEEAISVKQKVTSSHQAKYLEVVSYLQAYKEAFTSQKVLATIGGHLGSILQMDGEERSEDDTLMFERLLLLLRNVLHVPSNPTEEQRTDDDVSVHDQVLWNMHINGVDDLLIYITSSPDEAGWAMHAIEIINLMLKEQNPEKLAKASSRSDTAEDVKALKLAKEKDAELKRAVSKKVKNTRHSRFGGSFWVQNMKGVGNKATLVHHKHVTDVDDISFDDKKYKKRVAKRKQEAKETTIERSSTLSIRLFLKEFCVKFLEHCYNPLMRVVKNNVAGRKTQENDETYYLWAIKFFMAFNRSNLFKVEYVSETLNLTIFHYILKEINTYHDQVVMHKKGGWEPWQKRLHMALQAYKELLIYISNMSSSQDQVLQDASSVIKNNVFYHEEYRNIFLILLRHYVANKQTKKYLADLVDTFHVFLKLLERFCKDKGTLLTKTKKRTAKRRKKATQNTHQHEEMSSDQLDEVWENNLAPSLSAVLQGNEELGPVEESVFDPSSDVPVDEQRYGMIIRIQDHLRAGRMQGIGLLKAAREVWPEEEAFGRDSMTPEDEFMIVRSLLFKELDRSSVVVAEENNEEINEEEEEEENQVHSVEREFNLKSFLIQLTSAQMIMPYAHLLRWYETNSVYTNHAIVKALHRVAVDMKLREMFYQVSMFVTFRNILNDPSPRFKELAAFARHIVGHFVEFAKTHPNIYVEALFWKGSGDCYQISERDDLQKRDGSGKAREKWSFEDEEELKTLFDQYKETEDVVGEILKNITDKDRTRRQISNKLVRLKMVESAKDLPREKKTKPPKWMEAETEEVHRLYDEFKESDDVMGNIMNATTFVKSKNMIIKHLLETGKVEDRSELYKKKKRKKNKHLQDFLDAANKSASSSGESDDDGFERLVSAARSHTSVPATAGGCSDTQPTNGSRSQPPAYDRNKVLKLCHQLKQSGFYQQIIWLQTRLKRAAEGREEDDDWYGVPLLTLTEEDESALSDDTFQRMLRLLQLNPPADEQETYWRIPETLAPSQLNAFAVVLGEKYDPENSDDSENDDQTSDVRENSEQINDFKENGEQISDVRENGEQTTENRENSEQIGDVNDNGEQSSTKGVKRDLEDDSDGESEMKREKKKKRVIDDEDGDFNSGDDNSKQDKITNDDFENETNRNNKDLINDSENDSEVRIPLQSLSPKQNTMESTPSKLCNDETRIETQKESVTSNESMDQSALDFSLRISEDEE